MRENFPRRPSYKATPQNSRNDGLAVVDFFGIYSVYRDEEERRKRNEEREREREGEMREVPQDARAPEGDSRELGFIA